MGEKNDEKNIRKKKNILVIDDSALMRRVTSDIINKDPRFCVTDFATNGFEALDIIYKNFGKYDAVVCDINMPKMTGIEVLRALSRHKINIRVVMSSTMTLPGAKETILALELGAFDFVTKPSSYIKAVNSDFGKNLMKALYGACELEDEWDLEQNVLVEEKVELAEHGKLDESEKSGKTTKLDEDDKLSIPAKTDKEPVIQTTSKVTKLSKLPKDEAGKIHLSKAKTVAETKSSNAKKEHKSTEKIKPDYGMEKIVVIASSTGGPKALSKVIPKLEADIDAPIVIVQHMPEGFTSSLAARLDEISRVKVVEASDEEPLSKGTVYIAKGGRHLKIEQKDGRAVLRVYDGPAIVGLKPCADITIESLNDVSYKEMLFVVMTGMGQDGTKGLKALKDTINKKIIVQDQKSSAVYGMPRAVVNAGLADGVFALDKIAKEINQTTGVRKHGC